MELGGKNTLLALDDTDVDQAASEAVRACFVSKHRAPLHLDGRATCSCRSPGSSRTP
ncbi:hypothetical protein ACIHAE_07955 [Streptomyces parvulus]|uniref:hypothetical protein n=1 Tax=Streptomyces parvulus TaxID=146923 RepID=UPI0037D19B81